jgi:hypothetical protein
MATEFLTLLALGLFVIVIAAFAVYFYGAIPGVIISLLFAAFLAVVYADAPAIFSPYASSRQATHSWSSYFTDTSFWQAFAVCFFIGAMSSIGADFLFSRLKDESVNQTFLLIWLAVLILPPAGIYTYFKVAELRKESFIQANFVELRFEIYHYTAMPVLMQSFRFKGSKTPLYTDLKYYQEVSFLVNPEALDNTSKKDALDMHRFYRSDYSSAGLLIPRLSDSIELAWYSLLEDKIYKGEIRLPVDGMVLRDVDQLHPRAFIKGELTLDLYPQGQVSLRHSVYREMVIEQSFSLPAIKGISDEDRRAFREKFLKFANESVNHDKLLSTIDIYQRTEYLSKLDAMRNSED